MMRHGVVVEYNMPHLRMDSVVGPDVIEINIGIEDVASLILRVHALMDGRSVEFVRFRTENNPVEIRVSFTNEQGNVRRLDDA